AKVRENPEATNFDTIFTRRLPWPSPARPGEAPLGLGGDALGPDWGGRLCGAAGRFDAALGQAHDGTQAAAGPIEQQDVAAVAAQDRAGDREPKPDPAGRPAARGFQPDEGLENLLVGVSGDAAPVV